jgi:hypothetical protein
MSTDFDALHNHYEAPVFRAVNERAAAEPGRWAPETLQDVACVALNRLPARYIRHDADFYFFLSDEDRRRQDRNVAEAVAYAFQFVSTRQAQRSAT